MAEFRDSVEAYRLNADRRRVMANLTPLFRDEKEKIRFADFIDKMPWNYSREVPHEVIASHWKVLRNIETSSLEPDETYSFHHTELDSWIGQPDLLKLPTELRKLAGLEFSPLLRSFNHADGKLSIAVAYHKNETGVRGYPLEPPTWIGQFKRTQLNSRKQSSSIAFDTVVLENSTVFRIEVNNSPQTIVVRKMCEIMQRHQIMPSSVDCWSAKGSFTGSRKIKERHSLEIEVRDSIEDDMLASIKSDVQRYLVAQLKVHSLFDIIGPAMIGPSSSHTAGACRIGCLSRNIFIALQEAGHFNKIENFEIRLFGSFRDTGPGHGTHIALGAGLKGLPPDSPMLKKEGDLACLVQGGIPWPNQPNIAFRGFSASTVEEDRKYIRQLGDCINIAEIIAQTDKGSFTVAGFSTGGGIIEIRYINTTRINPTITGKRDLWISDAPLGNTLVISRTPLKGRCGKIGKIYTQHAPLDDVSPMFNTFDEALDIAAETHKSLLTLALETEMRLQGTDEDTIFSTMESLWEIMKESVYEGLRYSARSAMGLSGGDSQKLMDYLRSRDFMTLHPLASVYAMASAETNAHMGRIVACPTAGACGIIPGVMLAWYNTLVAKGHDKDKLHRKVVEALLVAAFIGMIFYDDIPTAGATLGCQAEIGIGAAMAAAAMAHLNDGSPEAVVHAAILTIKNCMGLTCDPVAGLVEVPCIKRNAMFSNFAVTACDMALAGIRSQIPPDQVVLAVKEVGENMSVNYKETARGGLATTLNGKDVARRFDEMCRGLFSCSTCRTCH